MAQAPTPAAQPTLRWEARHPSIIVPVQRRANRVRRRCALAALAVLAAVACDETPPVPTIAPDPAAAAIAAREALPEWKWIPGLFGEREPDASRPPLRHLGFDATQFDRWERSHGDDGSTKFSSLTAIDRSNVDRLELAWSHDAGTRADGTRADWQYPVQANPIVADGRLYVPTSDDRIVALDPATGALRWEHRAQGRPAHRGLVYWAGDVAHAPRLYFVEGKELVALDARSGTLVPTFGDAGRVRVRKATAAPAIDGDRLLVAINKPAALRAFDLRTGEARWETRLRRFGGDGSGCAPWGGFSLDARRGRAYVTTGNPRPSMYGIGRPGDNPHCNSVVSIDTATGEIDWAFQEVAHDLWNLDIAAPPALATVEIGGTPVDVVAAATKLGNTLLLERDTGRPLFDYRMRRAPASRAPSETTAAYQPDLVLPEPMMRPDYRREDAAGLGPESRRSIEWQTEGMGFGYFHPPEVGRSTIVYGLHGGVEWPGVAIDPDRGLLYAPINRMPWRLQWYVRARTPRPLPDVGSEPYQMYAEQCAHCHGRTRSNPVRLEDEVGLTTAPSLVGTALHPMYVESYRLGVFERRHARVRTDPIDQLELDVLREWFAKLDRALSDELQMQPEYYVTELRDDDGYPGTTPPWGEVVALDLATGRIRWRVPFGEYPELRARGLPPTGQTNFGGLIATRSGLVFATGTIDERVRAFDGDTGAELWSRALPAAGSAPPTTYEIDGRQFVVVVATGGRFEGFSPGPAFIQAFALPADD